MVGLDLRGLCQLKQFCDSVSVALQNLKLACVTQNYEHVTEFYYSAL